MQLESRIDLKYRDALATLHEGIAQRYWQNEAIETLMASLTDGVDGIITEIYEEQLGNRSDVALYAVGGYGRGELHPGSDVDLLIVATRPERLKDEIAAFWQAIFDLNIEVGHAVRDPKGCKSESRNDLTVATAMFERRFLCGDRGMIAALDKVMGSKRIWPAASFYRAKRDEQLDRHKHYDNIDYNLEPNVKTSPGGLRDIHTALWICQRQFGTSDPERLVELDVLTEQEQDWLLAGRRFLWWIRFGLHLVAGRKEDQLQFAHQRELAERLGFVDTDAQRGVERLMHHYYRHVLALTEVNDILLQYFEEHVVKRARPKTTPINERFQLKDEYIEAVGDVFRETPSALLEMFVIMANRTDIAGVRADTIRLIRRHVGLIDETYRNNPAHTALFMDLLKAPYTLVSQLTRMRRYGILGRYIPEFGRVVGQMQHDLFHIYTVDAHTMTVIGNMRKFRYRASREKFPVAHHCVHTMPKVELLYIAGLYHDIGKGRGGDHSELGAVDARAFCDRHRLNEADTDLVCWLVEQHLLMSSVSQREDIYDPEVVHAFASEVKSEMRLDYLYALTVADINATNPTLWNSWRATLLRQLYMETRKALRRGLESPTDRATTIAAYQERALERLNKQNEALDSDAITELWRQMGDDFFLRHTPPQIASITAELMEHDDDAPYVGIHQTFGDLAGEGATQVVVAAHDSPLLFARTVVALSEFDLSIVDATINTDEAGLCFDIYTVLNEDGEALDADPGLRESIVSKVQTALAETGPLPEVRKRLLPRQMKELARATDVELKTTETGDATQVTIGASDRPGLLAKIAVLLAELGLELRSAKIATLGERVEDTFIVTTEDGAPVSEGEASYVLTETLRQRIDAALREQ